jgi:hypothetical protein
VFSSGRIVLNALRSVCYAVPREVPLCLSFVLLKRLRQRRSNTLMRTAGVRGWRGSRRACIGIGALARPLMTLQRLRESGP